MPPKEGGLLARMFKAGGRASVSPAATLHQLHGRLMAIDPTALEGIIGAARVTPDAGIDRDRWCDPSSLIEKVGDIGILRVEGPTFQKAGILSCIFGGVGYDEIAEAHRLLMADPDVARIVEIYDTPGGDAAGLPDLADAMFAARGQKPVAAFVSDAAFSAGYWLASTADSITLTRTSGVGSIGVVAAHIDISGFDEKMGLDYSFIHAGERKVDYTMHRPLSDEARERLQAEVDRLYGLFTASVARNRGMAEDAVRGTQAGMFFADNAVAVGLADRVATLDAVLDGAPLPSADPPEPDSDGDEGGQGAGGESAAASAQAPELGVEAAALIPGDNAAPAQASAAADAAAQPVEPESADDAAAQAQTQTLPEAVAAADIPADVGIALLKRGSKDEPPDAQIRYAQEMRDICTAAGLPTVAAGYVQRGTAIEAARAELLSAAADPDNEVSTHLPAMGGAQSGTTTTDAHWGAITKKFGG